MTMFDKIRKKYVLTAGEVFQWADTIYVDKSTWDDDFIEPKELERFLKYNNEAAENFIEVVLKDPQYDQETIAFKLTDEAKEEVKDAREAIKDKKDAKETKSNMEKEFRELVQEWIKETVSEEQAVNFRVFAYTDTSFSRPSVTVKVVYSPTMDEETFTAVTLYDPMDSFMERDWEFAEKWLLFDDSPAYDDGLFNDFMEQDIIYTLDAYSDSTEHRFEEDIRAWVENVLEEEGKIKPAFERGGPSEDEQALKVPHPKSELLRLLKSKAR